MPPAPRVEIPRAGPTKRSCERSPPTAGATANKVKTVASQMLEGRQLAPYLIDRQVRR